tara:strand:+ start:529 stop:993 length:465 start_codon:yes stop_codon:yes gene_type:complete
MTKIKQLILTITFTIIFIICWSFNNAQTQEVICGPRAYMLENMELRFGEKEIERGIDTQTGMMLLITANTFGNWSLLLTPASNPKNLCVPLTGTEWKQAYNLSSGTAFDGSTFTIQFTDEGDFKMYWLDKNTKTLTLMLKGYDWTRFWEFDKTL